MSQEMLCPPPECLTDVQFGLATARRGIGNLLQILLGLFQPVFAQGQIEEYSAGVVGLRSIAPALDDLFGQGLHTLDRRRPRFIASHDGATLRGPQGRSLPPDGLREYRSMPGPAFRPRRQLRPIRPIRSGDRPGNSVPCRILPRPLRAGSGRVHAQCQPAVLQGLALRGGDLLLALALRIAIVADAGPRGLFLLGLGGKQTIQGRLGMIAGVGKSSRLARRCRAKRRIEQTNLGLRLIGPSRGGHDVELLPRPIDLLGPQAALLRRRGRQGLQIGQRRLAAEKTDGQIDLAGNRRRPAGSGTIAPDPPLGDVQPLLVLLHLGPKRCLQGLHGGLPAQRVEIGRIVRQAE